jgi:hypothetical protein
MVDTPLNSLVCKQKLPYAWPYGCSGILRDDLPSSRVISNQSSRGMTGQTDPEKSRVSSRLHIHSGVPDIRNPVFDLWHTWVDC